MIIHQNIKEELKNEDNKTAKMVQIFMSFIQAVTMQNKSRNDTRALCLNLSNASSK